MSHYILICFVSGLFLLMSLSCSLLGHKKRNLMSSRNQSLQEESQSLQCCFCMNPIKGTIVEALGKTWHPDHFRCEECKRPIEQSRFHVKDGLPYCEQDYTRLFLSVCSLCNLPIRDVVIVGLGKWTQLLQI